MSKKIKLVAKMTTRKRYSSHGRFSKGAPLFVQYSICIPTVIGKDIPLNQYFEFSRDADGVVTMKPISKESM